MERHLKGTGISQKSVSGEVFVFSHYHRNGDISRYSISDVENELRRLNEAIEATRKDLTSIYNQMHVDGYKAHADIVRTHLMILDDESFYNEVVISLEQKRYNIEHVLDIRAKQYIQMLEPIDDPRFRERTEDLLIVIDHILRHLKPASGDVTPAASAKIIVARNLSPSDLAFPALENAAGLITEAGGMACCPSVMAHALEIPAVIDVADIVEQVTDGANAVLDCVKGLVILDPEPQTILRYHEEARDEVEIKDPLGLHVRPSSQLAECASKFKCEISINNNGHQVNGKSLLGILSLNAPFESRLEVICKGSDASAALKAIKEVPL